VNYCRRGRHSSADVPYTDVRGVEVRERKNEKVYCSNVNIGGARGDRGGFRRSYSQ